ncbi:hypothetical protein IWQ60_011971 [Tieghemiomyces parasiticus]|uniref:Uncharacterized protein n=1 Tax=Tieghemiomyces parasiticus TaxID=78921 RepID=A0A9W7ZLW2_9FUNG|nr:hypothetical protein IWQ60_011971 [Tieghemiomyces parasiticus]
MWPGPFHLGPGSVQWSVAGLLVGLVVHFTLANTSQAVRGPAQRLPAELYGAIADTLDVKDYRELMRTEQAAMRILLNTPRGRVIKTLDQYSHELAKYNAQPLRPANEPSVFASRLQHRMYKDGVLLYTLDQERVRDQFMDLQPVLHSFLRTTLYRCFIVDQLAKLGLDPLGDIYVHTAEEGAEDRGHLVVHYPPPNPPDAAAEVGQVEVRPGSRETYRDLFAEKGAAADIVIEVLSDSRGELFGINQAAQVVHLDGPVHYRTAPPFQPPEGSVNGMGEGPDNMLDHPVAAAIHVGHVNFLAQLTRYLFSPAFRAALTGQLHVIFPACHLHLALTLHHWWSGLVVAAQRRPGYADHQMIALTWYDFTQAWAEEIAMGLYGSVLFGLAARGDVDTLRDYLTLVRPSVNVEYKWCLPYLILAAAQSSHEPMLEYLTTRDDWGPYDPEALLGVARRLGWSRAADRLTRLAGGVTQPSALSAYYRQFVNEWPVFIDATGRPSYMGYRRG